MGKQWKQWQTFWGAPKITADDDCSHEIKRHLLLGRKAMTNLDSTLRSKDVTLPTNVCLVKAMFFPVVIYGCESWTIKKAERWRIDAFELWCWKYIQIPWTARRSNQSILREMSSEYSLEGLMLKLKFQYSGHLMRRTESLEKTLMLGKTEGRRGGWQRMRWLDGYHRLDGHEFEQASRVGWWTGKPGMLQSMESQRVGHDWAIELTISLQCLAELKLHYIHFMNYVFSNQCNSLSHLIFFVEMPT